MIREVIKFERIKYTVLEEEIRDLIIEHAKTVDNKSLGLLIDNLTEVKGLPDKIEFIFEYPIKIKKS